MRAFMTRTSVSLKSAFARSPICYHRKLGAWHTIVDRVLATEADQAATRYSHLFAQRMIRKSRQ
jgi:hypothetical protein